MQKKTPQPVKCLLFYSGVKSMKTIFFKGSWLLLVFISAGFLPAAAQTATPTPLTNILTVSKTPVNEPNLFLKVLATRLSVSGLTLEKFCPQDNILTRRILKDYGAVF